MGIPSGLECPSCRAANRGGRRFCAQCGAALPVICATCGFANEAKEKFCGGCGAPLAIAPPPDTLRTRDEGELRPITVLFADLAGFTRLSQQRDPEEVHRLLERYFETVDAIVVNAGGSVDKHIGDAVMAVFGAPVAHGNEALRSVRAAAEIQRAVPALGAELGIALAVHIGIASGEVVASGLGSAQHRAYTVIGHSVNLAARLLALAQAGETVLDDAVHAAAERIIRCVPIEGATAKGIDAPLRAWRLVEVVEASGPEAVGKFIGRHAELAQLTALLESSAAGSAGGTVCVRGDAGIGKSRLIGELRRRATDGGFACHAGLVLDFGMAAGRDAVRELVAGLVESPPGTPPDARAVALERAMTLHSLPPSARPFLRDLLDLPQPEEDRALYEAMDNPARQRGREETLVLLLAAAAQRAPVLLVVEDIHWADRTTLRYVAALTRAVASLRAVLALTSRLEGDPLDAAWRATVQGSPFLTIDLGPLPEKDAMVLAAGWLTTSRSFARKCVERAAGNPLFLEQLMRSANEQGDHLPATLHSLVLARMDRLPERDRIALRAAAVVGQRFPLALVRHLAKLPDFVCDRLVAHYLVRPEGDEFLFAHALIRDGVYISLTRVRRAELHRAAAEWYGEREPTLKAEHLDRADAPEAPVAYAEAARARFAALDPERALALVERGAAIARERADVYALNLLHGELRREVGEGRPAVAAYELALASATGPVERCRALVGIAAGQRLIAGVDAAFAALAEAEPLAREQGLVRELAEIHYIRGNLHFARSEVDDCRSQHEAAFACARSIDDPRWEARALSGLGDADYASARVRTALDRFSRCVALFEAHAMARAALPNRVMIGHCRQYLNEFDAGMAEIETALTAAVRLGDRHAEMMALESLGAMGAISARYAIAEPAARRGLQVAEALGARRFQAILISSLAECAVAFGRRAEAFELVERALALARDIGIAFCGPWVLGVKLRLLDDPDERAACCAEAEAVLADPNMIHNHIGFRRNAIEDGLARRDWPGALAQAAALENYMRAEPLPYCDFLIARARALAGLARQPDDPTLRTEVMRLRDEADRLHWPIGFPEWAGVRHGSDPGVA